MWMFNWMLINSVLQGNASQELAQSSVHTGERVHVHNSQL